MKLGCVLEKGKEFCLLSGSMDPIKRIARAGYGIAIYEADGNGRERFFSAKYGRVVRSPRGEDDVPGGGQA